MTVHCQCLSMLMVCSGGQTLVENFTFILFYHMCVCVCVCVYIYIYIYIYVCVYICMVMNVCICVCVYMDVSNTRHITNRMQ